ncbi:hypothetical protein MCOR02_001371 [Pyricularia oryzae]|nr:hypothetical protein MCOR02_001371 [Pyricularia oryzae]
MADPDQSPSQDSGEVAASNTQQSLVSVDTISDSKVPLKDENAPNKETTRNWIQRTSRSDATTPSGEGNSVEAASGQPKVDDELETKPCSDSCPEPATEPMTPEGGDGYPGFDQKKASEPEQEDWDDGDIPPESEDEEEAGNTKAEKRRRRVWETSRKI